MRNPEFYANHCIPESEIQQQLLEDIRRIRNVIGMPQRFTYLRSLVKTRKNVRTVYPPGWSYR